MSAAGEDGRYTIVLTGRYDDERTYLLMDESGDYETVEGYPPVEMITDEISFDDLPEDAKERLLAVYRETWNI